MGFPFGLGFDALRDLYVKQFLKLLPPGSALSKRPDSTIGQWAEALVAEIARAHQRLDVAVEQAFPGDATSAELLSDWEKATGLPNDCTYLDTSESERQAHVMRKFAVQEGQNLKDFQSIAASRGYPTIDMINRERFRIGVHSIAHMPIYSYPWLYYSMVSYEAQDGGPQDAALECNLRNHAHAHTRMSFNPWDATVVAANLPSLRTHFVHGEFSTTTSNGLDLIDSWNNRTANGDWVDASAGTTNLYALRRGWVAASAEDATTRFLQGLYARNTPGADTLLQHHNFNLWLVCYALDYDGLDRELISSAGLNLRFATVSGSTVVELDYDGATPNVPAGYGHPITPVVIAIGVNGASGTMQSRARYNSTTTAFSPANGALSDEELFLISQSLLKGGFFELITSDYEGMPGTDPNVDAVTDYLAAKYLGV